MLSTFDALYSKKRDSSNIEVVLFASEPIDGSTSDLINGSTSVPIDGSTSVLPQWAELVHRVRFAGIFDVAFVTLAIEKDRCFFMQREREREWIQ